MARPREFDTERAIAEIADVFWGTGFEATSIADLEDATGLARARLYAAFGSKHDMLLHSIDYYLAGPLEMVFQRVDDGGLEAISNWFRSIAQLREERPERAKMGCLVVNSLVEFGDSDPSIKERGNRYRGRVRDAFTSALRADDQRGEIRGDIECLANVAYMLLLGVFVSIRSGVSTPEVHALATAAAETVDSWRVSAAA